MRSSMQPARAHSFAHPLPLVASSGMRKQTYLYGLSINPPKEEVVRTLSGRLFVERAQVVSPSFALTTENAPSVASICWRVARPPLAGPLVEAARGDRLEALYVLAVHTGMRREELLGPQVGRCRSGQRHREGTPDAHAHRQRPSPRSRGAEDKNIRRTVRLTQKAVEASTISGTPAPRCS